MSDDFSVLVTCEHGGNRVPKDFASLFLGREGLLASHRGWDPGALALARTIAQATDAPLYFSQVTRLLVDLNRSLHHPRLFSALTRLLPAPDRDRILRRWYHPYRNEVRSAISDRVEAGKRVLHLAIHSFTPVLDGKVREVDIGLLFDPARKEERSFCVALKGDLQLRLGMGSGHPRVRLNQPYLGKSDGFPTWLRKRFPPSMYLGIEVEISQGLMGKAGGKWRRERKIIVEAFRGAAG